MIRILVWNEFRHEKSSDKVREIYPEGMHKAIAEFLGKEEDFEVRTATLDEPECGLTEEVLAQTDVLFWWGHIAHSEVPDEIAQRVQKAVLSGMGLIVLHSGHHSKPFRLLMGTPCNLSWHEDNERERIWTVNVGHPIAKGLPEQSFALEAEETYGEPFSIPEPDELVFIGWYKGGDVFRTGCCFNRGYGHIFYFQPGHESFPTYYNPNVQLILKNAVRWAYPDTRIDGEIPCPHTKALES